MGLDEYTETLRKLVDNNVEEAVKFLFRVYDADSELLLYKSNYIECSLQLVHILAVETVVL